jgi:predicted naringenin-chalcone synthase
LGIADIAPRAMAAAVSEALQAVGVAPDQVQHVVPHQAGTGILRLASLKLQQLGIQAEVVNGITSEVGNVSSSSIPYALKQKWDTLDGLIACPTAAVGSPGKPEVSKGCILLETTASRGLLQKSA